MEKIMQILVIILAIWVRLPIWPFRRDPEYTRLYQLGGLSGEVRGTERLTGNGTENGNCSCSYDRRADEI